MTLLELLKRISHKQKIDLFNDNCTIIALDVERNEIIDILLLKFEKKFREIINCEVRQIYVEKNLVITLQNSF